MSTEPKQLPTAEPVPAAPAQADVPAIAKKTSLPVVLDLSSPAKLAAQAKDAYLYRVAGMVLGDIAGVLEFVKAPDPATATMFGEAFLVELIRSIRPRDALEEMLLIQATFVHQRIIHLSLKAAMQERTKNVAVVNQAVDGACNVFRRQMLALAEYRRASMKPADAGSENSGGEKNDANEQGSTAATPPALPALRSGIEVPAGVGAASPAVGAQHGSANGNGQVAVKTQRAEARGIQPGPARRTAPGKRVDPANARRRRRPP